MITFPFEHIVALQVPTNKDRTENVQKQIEKISNNVSVFNTVYVPNVSLVAQCLRYVNLFIWNGDGNGSAINCAISYYTLIKQAYDYGYSSILCFEDDIDFIDNKQTQQILDTYPINFKSIKYCWNSTANNDITYKNTGDNYSINTKHLWGTQCFALSREGMKEYIDLMNKAFSVADLPLFAKFINDGHYIVNYPICNEMNFKSTIQN